MLCIKCGNQLADNAKFCNKCGQSVAGQPITEQLLTSKQNNKIKIALIIAIPVILIIGVGIFWLVNHGTGGQDLVPEYATMAAPAEAAQDPSPPLVPETPPAQDEGEEPLPQNNAEYGRMVAEEFLSNFTAMFLEHSDVSTYMANLFGVEGDIGMHVDTLRDPVTFLIDPEIIPDELLSDLSFSDDLQSLAFEPVLWDINGDGIPVIGIEYYAMFVNGQVPFQIFKYAGGGYSHIGSILSVSGFYRDSNGRLLTLTGSWWEPPTVTFISLTNYGIYTEAMQPDPWHELGLDIDELWREFDRDTYLVPGLPLADLTPIPPMEDLAEQIRENLEPLARERFETSFDVLAELIANSPVDDSDDNANLDLPEWRTIFIERLRDVQEQMDEQGPHWDWYGPFKLYNDENIAILTIHHGLGAGIIPYIHGVGLSEGRGHGLGDRGWSSIWIRPEQTALYIASSSRWEHMESFYVLEGNNFVYHFGMMYDEWGMMYNEWDISFSDGSASEFMRRRAYVEAAALVSPQSFNTPGEAIAALENLNISLRGEPGELAPFPFVNRYILPGSNTRRLVIEDIRHLSTETLRLARNEIYARHGRLFVADDLQAHFNSMPWYHGHIAPGDFTEGMLSDIERENVAFIQEEERERAN